MTVLHVNAGNEFGGGLFHILSLFQGIDKINMELLVFEEGPVAKSAREKNISVTVLSQQSRYDLSILKKLEIFIRDKRFDIVHSHGPRANLLVGLISKRLSAKWVTTIHSDPLLDFKGRGLKGKVFEWVNLKSLKRPDHLIAVSSEIKQRLIDQKIDQRRITVVHNGRAFFEHSLEEVVKIDHSVFHMITVGRLEWVKGHRYLIESLASLSFDDWKLTVCGSGEEAADLQSMVRKQGHESKIDFLGWVDAEAVSKQIASSDILINPSLSESFPLVALEAGEKKRPIIATDVGDVDQLLPTSDMGWLIPAADAKSLTSAIEEAHEVWKEGTLSDKGRRFYKWSKQFTIEKQGIETLEVYKKCLHQ